MKLRVFQPTSNQHTDMVTSVCWSPHNELVSCSDDKSIQRWSMAGESVGKIAAVDSHITDIQWFPSIGQQVSDTFAISCTDGTFRLFNRTGREEKRVQASELGAIITIRWAYDGSAIATGGEDGAVKLWSKQCNLRSALAQTGNPVYSLVWSPDNDSLIYANGKDLIIKSLQVNKKQIHWKAHNGVIMKVDWNIVNNLIVSGGEDRCFKVWDAFGRQLYQSQPFEHVITSISWSPNGEIFAVSSYNQLRLCDKTGWTYSRERTNAGSILNMTWTSDGTMVVGAGGGGTVVFGQLLERIVEWANWHATLVDPHKVRVEDVLTETVEDLEFPRDRVIDLSIGFGHLIVATTTQCFIYSLQNLNTPHIFDLRALVNLIIQSDKHFLMTDNVNGIQVYNYEGRTMSNPKFAGLRVEFLNKNTVSLSSEVLAVLDRTDGKTIRLFDVATGRALSTTITHPMDIVTVAMSQLSRGDRRIAFVDRNRDLYISPTIASKVSKLHTQLDSIAWNDESDQLVGVADSKLVTWLYPNVVYIDKDLLPSTTIVRDGSELGKTPQIVTFNGSRVTIRRADGALITQSVSPYPGMLYEFVSLARWEEAVRLCRYVKQDSLWACLAGMAINGRHMDTAEIALAAIKEVDKLHYIQYIKNIPSEEGKNAELLLYRRAIDEAEQILLQTQPPLIYRAIKMNIRLFRWGRALQLAIKHKTHVDTVLAYRQKFLQAYKKEETDPTFLEYGKQVQIDWDAISAKKKQEKENERARGSRKK